jgi:hypothetical protein
VQPTRRLREAAFLRYGDKVLEVTELHGPMSVPPRSLIQLNELPITDSDPAAVPPLTTQCH